MDEETENGLDKELDMDRAKRWTQGCSWSWVVLKVLDEIFVQLEEKLSCGKSQRS